MDLIARGRDADVFALGRGRVLRRYRAGGDVAAEAAVMRHVASHGFPVPRVWRAEGADLVLDRVHGLTLSAALARGELGIGAAARMLADLHRRLHALPPIPGHRAAVLHLDLHPENVLVAGHGPVLIDWRNARDGVPELDLAVTALILAEIAVDDTSPVAAEAGALLRAFAEVAEQGYRAGLPAAVGLRRGDPALSAQEKSRLDAAAALAHEAEAGGRGAGSAARGTA